MKTIHLLVGTHKGAFRFSSDADRNSWEMHGPFLKGEDINHIVFDQRNDMKMYACVNSPYWGSGIKMSSDLGRTWESPESDIKFSEDSEHTL